MALSTKSVYILILIVVFVVIGAAGYFYKNRNSIEIKKPARASSSLSKKDDSLDDYIKSEYNVDKNITIDGATNEIDSNVSNKIDIIKDSIQHDLELFGRTKRS